MINPNPHQPVLLTEVVNAVKPKAGEHYFDGTAGYGGHATEIIKHLGDSGKYILNDKDPDSISFLTSQEHLQNKYIVNGTASQYLRFNNVNYDIILYDAGISSYQLDTKSRGFSFKSNSRLDMRFDKQIRLDAEYIVNNYTFAELMYIFRKYGEAPQAVKITNAIIEQRNIAPIKTTEQLVNLIEEKVSIKKSPLAQYFQALRIEINQELLELEWFLKYAFSRLNNNGRLAVITFHSLEDRIVKNYFKDIIEQHLADPTVNVTASDQEIELNPRSRSARLRVVNKKQK